MRTYYVPDTMLSFHPHDPVCVCFPNPTNILQMENCGPRKFSGPSKVPRVVSFFLCQRWECPSYYFPIWVSRGQLGFGCEFLCCNCLCGFGVFKCNSQTALSEGCPCFLLFQTSQGQTVESKQGLQDEEIFSLIHRTNGNPARGSWTELSEKSSL